ncbi:MAG: hypothetical protein CMO34_05895 [Verrucomicrobia bacterium]|nr:hypothetical protein [Verrucomicrobiota bacterium]|tara:strand:- start:348 stop:1205 length:858 start_codon:yes stop_codon:yes gene_type:complete
MRGFLSLLLSAVVLTSTAQSISYEVPWLDYDNFFETKDIKQKSIESITFFKNIKKDGKPLGKRQKVLKYLFNKDGLLTKSIKYSSNKQKIDSNFYQFEYNEMNELIRRDEHFGIFHFCYQYHFENGLRKKMVKIDMRQNPPDTTLIRHFEYLTAHDYQLEVIKNELGIAFQKNRVLFDEKKRIIKKRTSYMRNAQFKEQLFYHEKELLQRIDFNSSYTNENRVRWLLSYKQNELDLIRCFSEGILNRKYALIYDESQFLEHIIERNVLNHTVTVYDLEIRLFNQN